MKSQEALSFFDPSNGVFFKTIMPKFIENRGCIKIRDISFKESISDPTMVITIETDNEMVTIPYTVGDTHPVRVIDRDIPVSPPIQMEEPSAQVEGFPLTVKQIPQPL